ncbi:hypothetical protein BOX15_Mlig010315g1 [Macrostomum lignano]|uniref:WSC domain-containing protein n=2 Tax=Macrostomum lignano TaxID=282301 RepID=A0A1I8GTV7_9PLAT|nr:hypothetical protein BOX15_Mlig010315g3 [Macrostomum lignano]PAA82337.1 hypothetical protein BOX15_Mlig010315g2 [Macrostomum lignano]PAA85721.1 hypothetical protein BOX15_Mlig010315g1 [Macrostomum lignano]
MISLCSTIRILCCWYLLVGLMFASNVAAEDEVVEETYDYGSNYKGCFEDNHSSPDMGADRTRMYEMTLEKCTNWCKGKNTKYMGMQDGDTCSCGDHYGKYGMSADFDCSVPCEGNVKERCGGISHNAVYSL